MIKLPFLFSFFFCIQLFSQETNEQTNPADIIADFEIDSSGKPIYQFINKSTNAQVFHWYFYQKTSEKSKIKYIDYTSLTSMEVIKKDYRDSIGKYYVCLIAHNTYGNSDTFCKMINTTFKTDVFIKNNSFCPNCNDTISKKEFVINIDKNKQLEQYNLKIFSRWGNLVFESNDQLQAWNGKQNNNKEFATEGVYYYVLQYKYLNEDKGTLNGTVHLILK